MYVANDVWECIAHHLITLRSLKGILSDACLFRLAAIRVQRGVRKLLEAKSAQFPLTLGRVIVYDRRNKAYFKGISLHFSQFLYIDGERHTQKRISCVQLVKASQSYSRFRHGYKRIVYEDELRYKFVIWPCETRL